MPWKLAANVHWCNCNGRAVFLDVRADRYFCLPLAINTAFLNLVANTMQAGDHEQLAPLRERGLLVDAPDGEPMHLPPHLDAPQSDFARDASSRAGLLGITRSIIAELRTAYLLRRKTFAHVVERARTVRRSPGLPQGVDRRSIERLVAAANAAAFFLRSHDRCLVRGLAFHACCRRRGVEAKLVLGVVAHPFTAHCWVQFGSRVLIGGYEQARLYTPILVLE